MFLRIIKNDMKNSKLTTITIFLIIATAAMLVSLTCMLIVNLTGAVDALMVQAKTPHFMQMHSGDIDKERLAQFAQSSDLVKEYQVVEFLNIKGPDIVINGKSLAQSVQDNGFSVQNADFDLLLGLDGKPIHVQDGEIYLPLYAMKDKLASINDSVVVAQKTFIVAGFVRDSQMNSLLSSSKRFLISENDYAQLADFGHVEYLIEFRLHELSQLSAFAHAYTMLGLEANGPTITYPLFKLINSISDGLMVALILMSSLLILAIAFLCIHFTLLAKIEDDLYEIGVMKAIGLRSTDIKHLYMAKYACIGAFACIVGYFASLPMQDLMLKNIHLFFGESQKEHLGPLLSVFGISLVFIAINLYVHHVLKRFKHLSSADALRTQGNIDGKKGNGYGTLQKFAFLTPNVFLGIKDVLSRKHLYATMFIVFVLATFIMIVPRNLYTTISSKSFITYMGVGECDLRIDLQQVDDIREKAKTISTYMESDQNIETFVVLSTKSFTIRDVQALDQSINVELGNHTLFPVTYAKGRAPLNEGEIALSSLNAEELNKEVGDTLVLIDEGEERVLKVCGLYSDITNGGKTAKATFDTNLDSLLWSVIVSSLHAPDAIDQVVQAYGTRFSYAKVSGIDEFILQTFGSTLESIKKASLAAILVSLLVSVLIAALFIKMLMIKDRYPIAVLKALGFTHKDIRIQYVSRSLFVLFFSIVVGTLLANTLGEYLCGAIIASLGATVFSFTIHPLSAYVLFPALLLVHVSFATVCTTSGSLNASIATIIKE